MSGTAAGLVSMTAIYPLENIRSRLSLQTNNDHYKGVLDVLKKTKTRELYNGLRMSLLGFTPYNALNFTFYNMFKTKSEKIKINDFIKQLLCGGLAGCFAVSITYPTDLIRRRLQLQGFDERVPKYDGIIDSVKKIYKAEGIVGYYRGLMSCYMKIFPALAVQFYVLEKLNALISS
jgi:hypothetical protein